MLPEMSNIKRNLIAGVAAVSMMTAGASPALAWGEREQKFLAGVLSVLAVQALIREANREDRVTRAPAYEEPVRYARASSSINATPVARAFNSYSDAEQRRIQASLAAYGFYRGGIDGSFGPGTYGAINRYAERADKTAMLRTTSGAFGLLDGLLY